MLLLNIDIVFSAVLELGVQEMFKLIDALRYNFK